MQVKMRFVPSDSPDVESYAIYVCPADEPLTKANATMRQVVPKTNPDADGKMTVLLNGVPNFDSLDGVYNFGVATIDDAGNESPLLTEGFENVSLDFVPPNPPTAGEIVIEQ
jgi:hypothetical protein